MNTVMNTNASSEGNTMTFFESIRVCLRKYAEFNGQASRAEFWWFTLFVALAASALSYVSQSLAIVFGFAVLLPFLAVGARRCHDVGRSGWWQLFYLVPAAGAFLVGIVMVMPTKSPVPGDSL